VSQPRVSDPPRKGDSGSQHVVQARTETGDRVSPPSSRPVPQNVPREPTPQRAPATPPPIPPSAQAPRSATLPGGSRGAPPRMTTPMASRSPSPNTPAPGSGVVMTRPAVIVGAPPKPPGSPPQRVRKAREEEARGFGQGLISEKSLDEVILAYLSEDAEDK
jgi:hypothetical protein